MKRRKAEFVCEIPPEAKIAVTATHLIIADPEYPPQFIPLDKDKRK